jgi:hypothetical protein
VISVDIIGWIQRFTDVPKPPQYNYQIMFRVKHRIAHAWKAPSMHRSLVNSIF